MKKQDKNNFKMTQSVVAAGFAVGLLGFVTGCGQSKVDLNRDVHSTNLNQFESAASGPGDDITRLNLFSVERLAAGFIPRQCTGQVMDRVIIPEFDIISERALQRLQAAGIPAAARPVARTNTATATGTSTTTSTAPAPANSNRGSGALSAQINEFRANSTAPVRPTPPSENPATLAQALELTAHDLQDLGIEVTAETAPRNRFLRYDVFTFPSAQDSLDNTAVRGTFRNRDGEVTQTYVAGSQRAAQQAFFFDEYPRSPWGRGSLFYTMFELNPTYTAQAFNDEMNADASIIRYQGLFTYLNPNYQRRILNDYVRLSRLGRLGYQLLTDESIASTSINDEERLVLYQERYNRLLSLDAKYEEIVADLRTALADLNHIIDANNVHTFSGSCDLFGVQETRCRNYFSTETCRAFCTNRLSDLGASQPEFMSHIAQANSVFTDTASISPGDLAHVVHEVGARLPAQHYLSWLAEAMHERFPRGLEFANLCYRHDATLPISSIRQGIQSVTDQRAAAAAATETAGN